MALIAQWSSINSLATVNSTLEEDEKNKVKILNLNNELDESFTRILVNEAHQVFRELHSEKPKNATEFGKFSYRYRVLIRKAVMELCESSANELSLANSSTDTMAWIEMYKMLEFVWGVCEIIFIDPQGSGAFIAQFMELLHWHLSLAEHFTDELLTVSEPEKHKNYWNAIYALILEGHTQEASKFLTVHPEHQTESFSTFRKLLETMPVYSKVTDTSHHTRSGGVQSQFNLLWNSWHELVMSKINSGCFLVNDNLNLAARLISGEDRAFIDVCDTEKCGGTWYSILTAQFFYANPLASSKELVSQARVLIDLNGGFSEMPMFEYCIYSALQYDLFDVINKASRPAGNWWFQTHLVDLLSLCPLVQDHFKDSIFEFRDFFMLDYVTCLLGNESLWTIGVDYLEFCPRFATGLLSEFLDHIHIPCEKKAAKLLNICTRWQLDSHYNSICQVMCTQYLKEQHLGSALFWALRKKPVDVTIVNLISQHFITQYEVTDKLPSLDIFDSITTEKYPQICNFGFLVFFSKCREIEMLLMCDDWKSRKEAYDILIRLIASRDQDVVPKPFYLFLLNQLIVLLQIMKTDSVSIDHDFADNVFELLRLIEDIKVDIKNSSIAEETKKKKNNQIVNIHQIVTDFFLTTVDF